MREIGSASNFELKFRSERFALATSDSLHWFLTIWENAMSLELTSNLAREAASRYVEMHGLIFNRELKKPPCAANCFIFPTVRTMHPFGIEKMCASLYCSKAVLPPIIFWGCLVTAIVSAVDLCAAALNSRKSPARLVSSDRKTAFCTACICRAWRSTQGARSSCGS
jgi:hypothetical protein